ncbi:unnamed protein product [Rotaria socialis]|uniref:LamG-like jellyroll fold domain-containing protein n=1 Tax=Rotaria socialis TaxID=392032 RepID=A0A821QWW9_9BILA|nr:unnamed protein product [Rotaria socialis]CAF4829945.1 unnamed protein product [Rotaria socialis]
MAHRKTENDFQKSVWAFKPTSEPKTSYPPMDSNCEHATTLKSDPMKPVSLWSSFRNGLVIGTLFGGIILAAVLTYCLLSPSTTIENQSPSTSTTTTSTTTATTATFFSCGYSCVGQTWASTINQLAQWSFDGTVHDNANNYLTSTSVTPTFITGYNNQALFLNSTLNPSLSTSYIPLGNTSFTIDAWLYPTTFSNSSDQVLVSMCPAINNSSCLYLAIRRNNSNHYLSFGFYNDDLWGATILSLNQWIHVAFVFDISAFQQSIYLNGFLDSSRTTSNPLLAFSGNFSIGYNSIMFLGNKSFEGYIDQLSVSSRVKSSCEILEEASLEAWFTFENVRLPLLDIGPYSLSVTASAYTIISGRWSSPAISFTGSNTSYFQAIGFTALRISNHEFSISFWVYPESLSGTLVHVSSSLNGTGWCMPFIGLTGNGSLVAQIYNGVTLSLLGPNVSLSTWYQVVQTWSPANGLQLYVNSWMTYSLSSAASFLASGSPPMYVTLANSLFGSGSCHEGMLNSTMPFIGAIDDFRVYSRELTYDDVCTIYNT